MDETATPPKQDVIAQFESQFEEAFKAADILYGQPALEGLVGEILSHARQLSTQVTHWQSRFDAVEKERDEAHKARLDLSVDHELLKRGVLDMTAKRDSLQRRIDGAVKAKLEYHDGLGVLVDTEGSDEKLEMMLRMQGWDVLILPQEPQV